MNTQSDYIRQAKEGNVAAFDTLIREHLPTIRRFALAFTSSQADADDLAQDAMVRAFRSIQSFRGDSAFSTWLYRLTRNAYIDRTRKRWFRLRSASVSIDTVRAQASMEESPEGSTLRQERRAHVWSALRTLKPKYKNVLVLIDIEGLEYADVAHIEGVPVGTIRSRLSRARQQLGMKLTRMEQNDSLSNTPSSRSMA